MPDCLVEHIGCERVKEIFRGQTVWDGTVEKFAVTGHPRANRAYACRIDGDCRASLNYC